MRAGKGLGGATLLVVVLTVVVTWPQALFLTSRFANHHDAQFSIWRLGWIAHALVTAPFHLFDANIFHPAKATLAYSDATMLEGLVAAPLFWLGVPPTLVYNLMLLAGFAGSGVAMFVLARHVTGQTAPALVAAAVFTVLPYRIEHFMHLELQWTMFVPLTLWAVHKAVDSGSRRWGAWVGVLLFLQILACVYYGVFLAMTLPVFVLLLVLLTARDRVPTLIPVFAVALLVAAVLTVPFAVPYATAAREVGGRTVEEIARYSASLRSYFATSASNLVWGWSADRWGDAELRLFPGLTAMLLALVALAFRPRSIVGVYALTLAFAVELSFGLNGTVYRALFSHVDALQGFRATARFAAIAGAALSVLSAIGVTRIVEVFRSARARSAAVTVALLLVAGEGLNRPMALTSAEPVEPPPVYQVIRTAPPGALLELPLPDLKRLPGLEPTYQLWSLWHWRPLLNGYSGYYPRDYIMTVLRMNVFPGEGTLDRLRAHDVRYIIVHRAFYDQDQYARLMLRMASRPELKPWGAYKDTVGTADIFELIPVD